MKKLALRFLAVMAIAITTAVSALGQNGFAYQAVIRDANGELVTNKQVEMKFTLKHDGASCYSETQTVTTNEYGNIQVVVGNGKKVDGDFASVPWNTFDIKMEVAVNVDGKGEVVLGEVPVQGAPYAMYAQKAGGITSKNANTKAGGALFAVNDANGNPVFAVFDDGIVVYVDDNADGAKAKRSGFVVTGRAATKGETATEYFSVTTEGTQIYVDSDPSKAKRSGFVVTGRAATKDGGAADYLTIDGKGTTVYVDDDSSKAKRSGFVVTGRAATKDGSEPQYFVATADGTTVYVDDTSSDKAKRSGFVVTGRAATKDGSEADYLAVDGSGTQVYIDGADVEDKAKRSGFVVTGRAATKAEEDTLFAIEGGFTRVYVDDNPDREAGKAKRSGFVVTGRAATKDNTNIFNVNGEGEVAILTEEFSVTETAAVEADTSSNQQSGEGTSTQEPAEQKQKSLFTISGGNVQVGTEMVMMGDVTKQIEADTINVDSVDAEFPQIAKIIDRADTVSCSAYKPFVYGNDSDSAGYALLGIYMKGNLAKITATDARRNTILLLDANGNVTKYQKNATVAVLMPEGDTQIYIRPLKATSQTINFGLMKKNSTEPYQYVKIEAEVEAQAGVPYKVITNSTEGGNVVVDGTVAHGDRPSFEAVPKTGYKFVRWSDGSTRAKRTFTIVDDFELSAEFERMSYVLTVKSDDELFGTVSGEGTYLHGDTAMVEATPATGYYFNNWSGVELSDDQLKNPSLALEVTAKLKLIAHFGIMQYTITFDTDGGSEVAAITQDYNTRIEAPADPQKEGFRFRGWSMAVPERMPAEDLTIKAIWGINKYFITIDAANGQTADTLMFDFGEIVDASLDEPEREGYTFQGWDATLPETMPAQDLVITAQWQLNKHNIVYVIDGREIETVEAYYNSTIEPIQAPIMEGYKFSGWQNVPETMPDSSITISGSYTAIEYGILFMNDGDTLQSTKVGYGQTPKYTGDEPARKADTLYTYEFIGWTPDIYAAESEQVYTAVFDTILRRYTILFESEGDTLTSKGFAYGQMPEYVGQTPEKKATAKFSYSFIGWVPTIVKVIADQTYTAAFDSTLNKYEIVFVSDESELQKDTLAYGQTPKYTGDEPTRKPNEQYTFKFYDWEPKIAEVTGDQVYTAVFDTIDIDYEILFMNGSDTLQADTLAYGETPKYTGDEPTRESNKVYTYTFIGWEPEVTSVRTNQTYTAVFDSAYVNYVVKFYGTGGKVLYYNDEAHYGDTIVAPDTDSVGYEFKGWNPAIPTPANVTEDFGTTGRWAAKTNTEYTVNIFLQNFEGKYDTDYPTESITLTGTTDTETSYQPADTTGFTLDTLKQTVISGNGQAAVYVYYKRNSHQLTWDANGGKFDNEKTVITAPYYYGADIQEPKSNPTRDGYDFDADSWSKNVPATMPDNDLTIKAQWILQEYDINYYDIEDSDFDDSKTTYNITETFSIANPTKTGSVFDGWTGTFWETATKSITISGKTGPIDLVANWSESSVKYTVTHHFEKVNGEYDSIVEEFAGRDGDETKAVAKDSTGFAAQDFSQLTIALNNTTNVDIYYNRISYKLIFKGNGGWFGYGVDSTYVDTKFGTTLSATEMRPTRDGYSFKGWPGLSGRTMPAKDTIIYAEWEANTNTAYKVNTWLQDTLCNDYTLYLEGEEFTGTTDAAISFEFNINGFTQKPFGEVKIAGDGKTVIDVYYDRLRYKATWKVNDTVYAETEKPYDSRIQLPDEPKSAGREFIAWVDDRDTEFNAGELMPFGGKTFYALFDTLYYSVTLPEGMEIISSSVAPKDEKYKYTSKVSFRVASGYDITGAVMVSSESEPLYDVDGVYELTIPAEDVTISAELTKLHTVRFFAGAGGSVFADGTNMKIVVVPHNSTISDVDSLRPTWDGHTLKRWLYYIEGNQNPEEYKFSNPITRDTIIAAEWVQTTIYVADEANAGSVSGSGISTNPYATIAQAVQTIKNQGVTNFDFTIRVKGTIVENAVIPASLNDIIASLTIEGDGGQEVTNNDITLYQPNGTLDGNNSGTVLKVLTTVPVTLRNIIVTNGNANLNTEDYDKNGGGIFLASNSQLTIADSAFVFDNKAAAGGGVYIDSDAKLIMTGGEISYNEATSWLGGGVYIAQAYDDATIFEMTGGLMSYNKSDFGSMDKGGAVYVSNTGGTFHMGGSAYIPAGPQYATNDVYLECDSDYQADIRIISNLTATAPVATIYPGDNFDTNTKFIYGVFANGSENTTLRENNYQKFDVAPYVDEYGKKHNYTINSDGKLQECYKVSFYASYPGELLASVTLGTDNTGVPAAQIPANPTMDYFDFLGWYELTKYIITGDKITIGFGSTPYNLNVALDSSVVLVAQMERMPLYVGGTVTDASALQGTEANPFSSISAAVEKINTFSRNYEGNYTIVVNGMLTEAQRIDGTVYANQITIIGKRDLVEGVPQDGIDMSSQTNGKSALYIATSDPTIVLKNLKLTGTTLSGKAIDSRGALSIEKAETIKISDGVLITGNKYADTVTTKVGSGIYFGNVQGSYYIEGSARVTPDNDVYLSVNSTGNNWSQLWIGSQLTAQAPVATITVGDYTKTEFNWLLNKSDADFQGELDKFDITPSVADGKTQYWKFALYNIKYGRLSQIPTVTFNYNDGTTPAQTIVANASGLITPPANLTREGYTFGGWFTAAEGGSPINFSEAVNTTITEVYAHWLQTSFFVAPENRGGSYADDVAGDAEHPFASVTKAFDTIVYKCANQYGTGYNYEIVVDSTVDGTQQMNSNYRFANQSVTITLRGKNGLKDGAPQDTLKGYNDGTVLTVANDIPLTIKNLVITGGNSDEGGGIRMDTVVKPNFTLTPKVTLAEGAVVTKNEASNGGGVYVMGNLLMTGGRVSDNRATYGGGVYIEQENSFEMTGGIISNNQANEGGAVYSYLSEFSMGGSAYIPAGVTLETGKDTVGSGFNDVYLGESSPYVTELYITSDLTATVPVATITPGAYYEGTKYLAGKGYDAGAEIEPLLRKANYNKFAVTPEYCNNENHYYVFDTTGGLKELVEVSFGYSYKKQVNGSLVDTTVILKSVLLAKGSALPADSVPAAFQKPVSHPYSTTGDFVGWFTPECNGSFDELHAIVDTTKYEYNTTFYGVWNETMEVSANGTFKSIDTTFRFMDQYCAYTVKIDGKLVGQQSMLSNYNYLCLHSITLEGKNGLKDDGTPKDTLDGNETGTTLNIQCCAPVIIRNLAITRGKSEYGGGIYYNKSHSNLTIADGAVISGNEAVYSGGGVYAEVWSNLTMTGGVISNNSSQKGGGVYIYSNGKFEMTDGTISGNVARSSGGGVYMDENAKMYMSGTAVIGDSTATSSATADNCSNKAYNGAGIFMYNASYGPMLYLGYRYGGDEMPPVPAGFTGGIYHNFASNDGGGISREAATGDVVMAGGTIAYNGAGELGSGAKINGGLTISGSANIAGGDVVYLTDGAKINVASALIGNAEIIISPASYNTETQVLVGDGVEASYGKFRVDENWVVGSDGYLKPYVPMGAVSGKFSIGAGKQVWFSQGNLQYLAISDTWRFAENQWDCTFQTNGEITVANDTWNDLFGWGTSGWQSGATAYQPNCTDSDNNHYNPGGSLANSLTGDYAEADWGVHNAISNGGNTKGLWRTLTQAEWEYLYNRGDNTHGFTKIGDMNGIVFLPDGCNAIIESSYTIAEWKQMEALGAVFLPAAGCINEYRILINFNDNGPYWSSSSNSNTEGYVYYFWFKVSDGGAVDAAGTGTYREFGHPVRLVQDVPIRTTFYVDPDADGDIANGSSMHPFTSIGDALEMMANNQLNDTIVVRGEVELYLGSDFTQAKSLTIIGTDPEVDKIVGDMPQVETEVPVTFKNIGISSLWQENDESMINITLDAAIVGQNISIGSNSAVITMKNGSSAASIWTEGTVNIAADTRIKLSNAEINGGIVCLGDAVIELDGENSVQAPSRHAGIRVGGAGTTLTIVGEGSLSAKGGVFAAGIGLDCSAEVANQVGGNIVINNGNITAIGGNYGAGIGTGWVQYSDDYTATIGDITILGGTLIAVAGNSACGIGKGDIPSTGKTVSVGTITISDDITRIEASGNISESVVYTHNGADVTSTVNNYLTIGSFGNKAIILPDITEYTVTIPNVTGGTVEADITSARSYTNITLTVTCDTYYNLDTIYVNDGAVDLRNNGNGTYSFQIPEDNVTVSVAFNYQGPITYINENGVEQTLAVGDYSVITGGMLVNGSSEPYVPNGERNFSSGTYVVNKNTIIGPSTISGDVNIILCNGATLDIYTYGNGNEYTLEGNYSLNIYAQSGSTGTLHTHPSFYEGGIKVKSFGFYGGNLYAEGNSNYEDYPTFQVKNLTFGYHTVADRIKISGKICIPDTTVVTIVSGKLMTDGENVYSGTLTSNQKAAINNKEYNEVTTLRATNSTSATPDWLMDGGNGHYYVDLGLSSGTYWATTNLGADSPTSGGYCIAWGETESYRDEATYDWKTGKEDGYVWSSYQFTSDEGATFSKYNGTDGKTTLETTDDAAYQIWGSSWVTPTIDDFEELYNSCYWVWTDDYLETGYGGSGFIVFKSADKSKDKQMTKSSDHIYSTAIDAHIFLPEPFRYQGKRSYSDAPYWTSKLGTEYDKAVGVSFDSANGIAEEEDLRCYGQQIRPVMKQ
ncbi:MAG: InlB B-repeat-containing protein [Salinivirgaceae bacterium]|nr:InlB B-repeat-containing protein [Salinivirgaceae bacterium]